MLISLRGLVLPARTSRPMKSLVFTWAVRRALLIGHRRFGLTTNHCSYSLPSRTCFTTNNTGIHDCDTPSLGIPPRRGKSKYCCFHDSTALAEFQPTRAQDSSETGDLGKNPGTLQESSRPSLTTSVHCVPVQKHFVRLPLKRRLRHSSLLSITPRSQFWSRAVGLEPKTFSFQRCYSTTVQVRSSSPNGLERNLSPAELSGCYGKHGLVLRRSCGTGSFQVQKSQRDNPRSFLQSPRRNYCSLLQRADSSSSFFR